LLQVTGARAGRKLFWRTVERVDDMTEVRKSVFDTDHKRLATLFDVADGGGGRLWNDAELAAILRHQLSAPIQVDLGRFERGAALKVRTLSESLGLTLKSFGDLLTHPNPPLELLTVTKDFAKACRLSPRSPVPSEVASVLYFACIAAGLVRCRSRMTRLSDVTLSEGFRWVLARRWLDVPTRDLTAEALKMLGERQGGGHA
jgi:hypothetical protein